MHYSHENNFNPDKNNASNIEEHSQSLVCLCIESKLSENLIKIAYLILVEVDMRQCNTNCHDKIIMQSGIPLIIKHN